MIDWDNPPPFTTYSRAQTYPAESGPMAINTLFLVRILKSERFSLAYSNRVAFAFDTILHREDRCQENDLILTLAGVTGIEVEYYLQDGGKGPWLGAFGGLSVLNQPFVQNYFTQLGFGAGGTLGWRFSPKLALELNAFYFSTSIPDSVIKKVEDLDSSLSFSGTSSGVSVTAGLRMAF